MEAPRKGVCTALLWMPWEAATSGISLVSVWTEIEIEIELNT
jgi:hypothetical protein